jgi:hypothetical protein
MDDFKELLIELLLPLFIFFLAVLIVVLFPLAWFDGHAKAAWIKRTKGIDVPWYQATFIEIQVNDANVRLEN